MLLSICIPSYNRFNELDKLIKSLLTAKSSDFNIYVIDNGSNEDVNNLKIFDDRVNFIKRETIVPGPLNCRTCLDYADGEYRMLCLDKDFIKGENLDGFIETLKYNKNISCGHCVLNSTNLNHNFSIRDTFIENRFYQCNHPSGYFFRYDVIEADNKTINHYDKDSAFYNNAFLLDLTYAQGLILGKEAVYEDALIETEPPEKAQETKSYSYSIQQNNIYFMPSERIRQFILFAQHLLLLDIGQDIYVKTITRLYKETLNACTFGYCSIMRNPYICNHHGIQCEKVSLSDMNKQKRLLIETFISDETIKLSEAKM